MDSTRPSKASRDHAGASGDAAGLILLTGATGYVGGRVLQALERAGRPVRCLARRPERLAGRTGPGTEVAAGDCLDPASLARALLGVHTAYYLVHSMGAGSAFEALDRQAARTFGRVARDAGVARIVYLGGLGDPEEDLSPHLRSRQEIGYLLRDSGVPVIEFRAGIVIGSGSLSFEMVRALTERLPVMVCPRWVRVATQPIGVEDLVAYLVEALERPAGESGVYEIGGPDTVSYGEIMREYARQRGLRRLLIPVPLLTPRLSSLWLALVTPLYAGVGRKLIDSLKNRTTVRSPAAVGRFRVRPRPLREALSRALSLEDAELGATRWSDAWSVRAARTPWGGVRLGARIVDSRAVELDVPAEQAFAPVARIGGREGWYYGNRLWRLRGFVDAAFGGVGLRRGRRHPAELAAGDALDFWRVEAVEPGRLLRLRAEMKLPGRAWLQFEASPRQGGGCELRQTALFDPAGLAGLLYWYALYPFHALIFRGMLRGIAARSATVSPSPPDSGARGAAPDVPARVAAGVIESRPHRSGTPEPRSPSRCVFP